MTVSSGGRAAARDVAELTVASGYPCISVLLPTEPAPRMRPADFEQLQGLVGEVRRRLQEQGVTGHRPLLQKLADEVRRAAVQPTDRGLAIYVSLATTRAFRLAETVEARALVEGTFATRALISSLHRMPPHVVLVLHPTCAHLCAAAGGDMRPVTQVDPFANGAGARLFGGGEPGGEQERDDQVDAYLRAVDRVLGGYRAEHPSPLVLAGAPALLDLFCKLSRNVERLAGLVITRDRDSASDFAVACNRAIEAYLRTRREDALAQLERALQNRPEDVATGISRCWQDGRSRRPEILLVEENFVSPGIPEQGPPGTGKATPVGPPRPGDVHDLVDDLMEQVILRGGQLALVRDGDLTTRGRIALITRP